MATASIAIQLPKSKNGQWLIAGAAVLVAVVAIAISSEQDDLEEAPPVKKVVIAAPTPIRVPPTSPPAPPPPVAKAHQPPKPKPIALSSKPNATVLDAKTEARIGRTPMELKLPRGATMELLLVAPGRKTESVTIDGKHEHVAVELERVRPKKREKRGSTQPVEEAIPPPPPPPEPPAKKSVMPEW
jgi:hypothetical protein